MLRLWSLSRTHMLDHRVPGPRRLVMRLLRLLRREGDPRMLRALLGRRAGWNIRLRLRLGKVVGGGEGVARRVVHSIHKLRGRRNVVM